ncbi:complex I NDUFA9 subunit family protein [Oharaeibacter diazotrophicus]|uniref:NADH dehydrogenase n=3 Tax=Oharaeibacter diazotrophicus TaxID=1920512 RepID=A0A4R6R6A3_9HYPH|nr:complex I NDUFA9 subunit family protein [Oharaeibacter diazotrophicus]TDP81460.1 NADH dehydrogenase [Oharaeibacter diazotrophicus]BBE73698.1 3-beta hydroxysteroid dehydrogenase/isomerase family protein [Pleomorphomonas sp. SM30]GLS75487.1 oxidoreductase [Oharaeibacter diazotrophicus]
MAEISDKPRLVTVFGGSGFLGRHVVRALARRGYRVRVAVRRPDLAGHLQPLGTVGQIHAVQANLRFRASVDRAVQGADAVVNLVGILAGSGAQTFDAVHAFGARAVAEAARAAGIGRLVHVSAIGADAASASGYARSKAAGEAAVRETVPGAVILRPSIVFGPEDDFFNRFADMARFSPVLPAIGGGETRFQPVFVGDVAEAVARAVDGAVPAGVVELGGPEVVTFREVMERVCRETGRKRAIVSVPFGIAELAAKLTGWLPGAPITADQVELLKTDNVVSDAATAEGRTLAGLGIVPHTMAAILPTYLYRYTVHGQYDRHKAV